MNEVDRRTRGKSRPGRLRLLDAWLLAEARPLLTRRDGAFAGAVTVDLGLGAVPWTTRELVAALRTVDPGAEVIGVDIDPGRVADARKLEAMPGLRFQVGGFDLPRSPAIRLVRAMNVLRQYDPADVPAAHEALRRAVLPGGLVIEGSTSRGGDTLAAHLLWGPGRPGEPPVPDALLFMTDFSVGFAPRMFARCLPRDLRPARRPLPRIAAGLDAWTARWQLVDRADPAAAFAASAVALPGATVGDGWVFWTPGAPRAPSPSMPMR